MIIFQKIARAMSMKNLYSARYDFCAFTMT